MASEGSRKLKKHVLQLLKSDNFESAIAEIVEFEKKKVINALISALCSCDLLVKWRAVSALGRVVAAMADDNPEDARVVMRRFMWMLNDESGGIGWGVPESMAEIMACHDMMAKEYAPILVSYLREDGNFLEYEPLQRGLTWGIGRLGSVRAELLKSLDVDEHLPEFLKSKDAEVRAMTAWACGVMGITGVKDALLEMKDDRARILFYWNGSLTEKTVGQIINEALKRL